MGQEEARCLERAVLLARAALFAGAVAVDDAALREVVGRHLELDAVAEKNLDPVAAQAAGQVCQDRVPVLEFNGKGRAWVDLADRTKNLKWGFFYGFQSSLTG